ncbi:MAG: hypothetical protein V9G20_14560 [Candidatus Promineifilaceae bacterium]
MKSWFRCQQRIQGKAVGEQRDDRGRGRDWLAVFALPLDYG